MRRGAENSHNYIKFNVSAATMRGLKSLWVQIVIADSYSDELGDENQPPESIPPCIVFHGIICRFYVCAFTLDIYKIHLHAMQHQKHGCMKFPNQICTFLKNSLLIADFTNEIYKIKV